MNWSLLLRTFGVILLAELGDKTQVAAFCSSASSGTFWPVFLGSSLALITATLLACLLGSFVSHMLPLRWVQLASGVAFVVLGTLILLRNLHP